MGCIIAELGLEAQTSMSSMSSWVSLSCGAIRTSCLETLSNSQINFVGETAHQVEEIHQNGVQVGELLAHKLAQVDDILHGGLI